MTRLQQFDAEVKEVIKNTIRMNMPDVKYSDASLCSDLANDFFVSSWTDFSIPSGTVMIKKWISENGFVLCKKSEAVCLLRVGYKCSDSGYWIIGQTKNYWLRPA